MTGRTGGVSFQGNEDYTPILIFAFGISSDIIESLNQIHDLSNDRARPAALVCVLPNFTPASTPDR